MLEFTTIPTLDRQGSNRADQTAKEIAIIINAEDSTGSSARIDDPKTVTAAVVDLDAGHDTPAKQKQRAEHLRSAHRAATVTFTKCVTSLVRLIGVPLTAYLSGVNETRAVRQWLTGERIPHPATQSKLQLALHVGAFLEAAGEGEVIAAWFQGLNPALDDQAPADLIRVVGGDEISVVGRRILAAAKEFVNN